MTLGSLFLQARRIARDETLSEEQKREALKAVVKQGIGDDSIILSMLSDPKTSLKNIMDEIAEAFFGPQIPIPDLSPEDIQKYLSMVDPETNRPYKIPYLFPEDPSYEAKYVDAMHIKEKSPDLFQKIMNWE